MSIRKGTTTKGTPTKADDKRMCHAARLPPEVAVLVKQEGRCQAWADRLHAVAKKALTKDQDAKFKKLNDAERKRILESINEERTEEKELKELILQ